MSYIIYAIKSINHNYLYVGLTSDLEERLRRHDTGRERTTKPYRPFKLIYQEAAADRKQARLREKYFKSGIGKEFLKRL